MDNICNKSRYFISFLTPFTLSMDVGIFKCISDESSIDLLELVSSSY